MPGSSKLDSLKNDIVTLYTPARRLLDENELGTHHNQVLKFFLQ
jgi:hypothetical protein